MFSNKFPFKLIAFLIGVSIAILLAIRFDIETKIIPATAKLPNGGQYYGELKDNLFSGEGKLFWTNDASYHGQFKQGLLHGYGKLVNAVGNTYQGQFIEGVFTGQGSLITFDGMKYQGQFENYIFNGHGRWEFEKGSHYTGQFKNGRFDGYGAVVYRKGESYNGNFSQGQYDGEGHVHYADGNAYKGYFKKGRLDGKGIYTTYDKRVYEGDFVDDKFTGQGIYTDKEGNRYEGGFKNWTYDGKGQYHSVAGDFYDGYFVAGEFTSKKGLFKGKKGQSYQGEFKNWSFDGSGDFLAENGDRYQGQFAYGRYNGKGILTYATPQKGKAELEGVWRYGRYIGDGSQPNPEKANVEKALYLQHKLLGETADKIKKTDPKQINMYFVGIGGDGKQDVFYKEVSYIRKLFDNSFNTKGRSAILVNNPDTVDTIPLTTITSIERILTDVAGKMDAKKDILFLYLTSHGSKKHELAIDQRGLSLPDLSANRLAKILKSLPVRWKVVVISACYSGGFIQPLKNNNTLIITAAAYDRTSFGCSDEAEMTYFGKAYFEEALTTAPTFQAAFVKAKELVHKWEEDDAVDDNIKHSNPQISKPKQIINHLKKWRKQLKQEIKVTLKGEFTTKN